MSARPRLGRKREDGVIARAISILERRLHEPEERYEITSPGAVHRYVRLKLGELDREVFVVIYLDAQHRPIALEEIARGTLTQTAVHPREVARGVLAHNAAGVVLAHNHPSGRLKFSAADKLITEQIRAALHLIDATVLDHLLVAGARHASLMLGGIT